MSRSFSEETSNSSRFRQAKRQATGLRACFFPHHSYRTSFAILRDRARARALLFLPQNLLLLTALRGFSVIRFLKKFRKTKSTVGRQSEYSSTDLLDNNAVCAHSRRSIGYEKDPRRRSVGILDERPLSSSHCVRIFFDVRSSLRGRNTGDFSSSENRSFVAITLYRLSRVQPIA